MAARMDAIPEARDRGPAWRTISNALRSARPKPYMIRPRFPGRIRSGSEGSGAYSKAFYSILRPRVGSSTATPSLVELSTPSQTGISRPASSGQKSKVIKH